MTARVGAELAFDAAIAAGGAGWQVRPEGPADTEFLLQLFAAHAPMADLLPPVLLAQQQAAQDTAFHVGNPNAMRRILLRNDTPVGRIIIDWSGEQAIHGVDVAVLQDSGSGGGLAMLRAWLIVADQLSRACTLRVTANNPARLIYKRLGFLETTDSVSWSAMIEMVRPPDIAASA